MAGDLVRCRCGNPSDGWPDELGISTLCQNCWESDCDESWWANFATNPWWWCSVTDDREPTMIVCEGVGQPTHDSQYAGTGMCQMCGQAVHQRKDGSATHHTRRDVLADLEAGYFD